MTRPRTRLRAVQIWAVAGVVLLLAEAAWRLSLRGLAAIRGGLTPVQWVALILVTAVFVYGEGVRALQGKWVPFVLQRIDRLPEEQPWRYRVAAPLYAMGLMGPTAAGRVRAWAGVAAIIAAVLIVSRLPDPWRGIIDTGVAAALVWGAFAMVLGAVRPGHGSQREI